MHNKIVGLKFWATTNFGYNFLNFFRKGLDRTRSKYIMLRIKTNKENCLQIETENRSEWTVLCSKGDRQCQGENDCNFVECRKKKVNRIGIKSN